MACANVGDGLWAQVKAQIAPIIALVHVWECTEIKKASENAFWNVEVDKLLGTLVGS